MIYICQYHSPLGGITIASNGDVLTGLWFDGQKYFGDTLPVKNESKELSVLENSPKLVVFENPLELPVFAETKRWLDIYFQGKAPDFMPPLFIDESQSHKAATHVDKADAHVDEADAHVDEADSHVDEAGSRVDKADAHVDEANAHVDEADSHFGEANHLDEVDTCFYKKATPFRMAVWEILLSIPYGQTMTYGEIAGRIAQQKGVAQISAQAVGGAVGHNPISIIVPCHRVVGTNGSLTGYAGGIDKKVKLLTLEKTDMSKFFIPKRRTNKQAELVVKDLLEVGLKN